MSEKKAKKIEVASDDQEDVIDLHEPVESEAELEKEIDRLAEVETPDEAPKAPEPTPAEFDGEVNKDTTVGELADQSTAVAVSPDQEFADSETTKAVDDIVAKESDEVLRAEDEARDAVQTKKAPKQRGRIKDFFVRFWENPATRWGTIVGLGLLLILVGLLPNSRYWVLNTFGVRASSSVKVIDRNSRQPLKNVKVSLGSQEVLTDQEGVAHFSKLKLGKSELAITKRGFAEVKRKHVLGWGSNPLGETELEAVGSQFAFKLTDFLSGQPVRTSEAVSGEFSAFGNESGEISLVVDEDDGTVEVTVTAPGYREEKVTFNATDTAEKTLSMAPGVSEVFVSKRSGRFEVFKIDADGKNETKLLEATGKERDDMSLMAHPTANYAAVVSTRDGAKNKDGFLLSGLFVINTTDGTNQKVVEDERVQLVDWAGDSIVFVQVDEGTSGGNPKRSRLMSFDAKNNALKELATANYFNDVYVARGVVYYAPAAYNVPATSVKFYKVSPDGSGAQGLLDKEAWSIVRGDYDTLYLSVQQDWYELKLGSTTVNKLSSPPASQRSLSFEDNADRTKALWADERDGKGVLLLRNVSDGSEKTLQTKGGLTTPLRWLNSTTAVYRIVASDETADYVISTEGGEAKKIVDVTNTGSAQSYFYY